MAYMLTNGTHKLNKQAFMEFLINKKRLAPLRKTTKMKQPCFYSAEFMDHVVARTTNTFPG